jgi:hypothetical protein
VVAEKGPDFLLLCNILDTWFFCYFTSHQVVPIEKAGPEAWAGVAAIDDGKEFNWRWGWLGMTSTVMQ